MIQVSQNLKTHLYETYLTSIGFCSVGHAHMGLASVKPTRLMLPDTPSAWSTAAESLKSGDNKLSDIYCVICGSIHASISSRVIGLSNMTQYCPLRRCMSRYPRWASCARTFIPRAFAAR